MRRPSSFLLSFLLLLSALAGCRTTEEGAFDVETVALEGTAAAYVPTLEGPLRPLSATPYGTMQAMGPEQVVAVTFSRPMVPLGEAPDVPASALTLQPAVPGRLFWEGTQTLVFRPDAPLPVATAYRATLAAGLRSLDGETLDEAFAWTFETPRPTLLRADPPAGEAFADPGRPIRLFFNQKVRSSVDHVVLRQAKGSRAPVTLALSQGDSALVLTPRSRLAPGQAYEVMLLPGLPSAEGRLGLEDTTLVSFRTYGPLRLDAVTQQRSWWEEEQGETRFDPERGVVFRFSTPVRFQDLRQAVIFSPAVEWPAGIEARDAAVSTEHAISLPLEPETSYTVTVRNLTDTFAQALAQAQQSFATKPYAPTVRMPEGLLVVEAKQRAAIPLRATNVESVRLGVQRLRQDQIVPRLRAYDREHWYGPLAENAEEPKPVAATKVKRLGIPRNVPSTVPLTLDTLLTGGTGVVGLHLVEPKRAGEDNEREAVALAQVTNLGLTAKFSPHQNLIFVTDLATARPVPGAAVTIRDADNKVRWTGTTDAQGRALTPGWYAQGVTPKDPWDRPVQYAFVEKDGDLAFTSSVFEDGLEPYRFEMDFSWRPEPHVLAGSVFTDRGLYKAGETVNVKGILRQRTDGDWRSITDSVRVLIRSPRDRLVFDRRFLPSDLGTFDFDYTAAASADQGVYAVRVVLASDTAAVGRSVYEPGDVARGDFRVDAFRRATFDVEARASAGSYVAGDFFEGLVSGRYLFGAAMQNAPVRYSLVRREGSYAPPGYDGYRFGTFSHYFDDRPSVYREIARNDTVLGDDGTARLRRPLPGNEYGTPTTLAWEATVTDPSRQEGSDQTFITLHPGLFYVGLKPRTTFLDLSRDKRMAVDVVTVDPAGHPVGKKDIEIEVVREQWNSVREVGADGRLRWRSERIEEPVATQRVTSVEGRASRLQIPISLGGSYVVRATARDLRGNTIRSEAYFYATGSGYVAWERADDDRIDIIPDQSSYRPGETARIMVQSPYEEAQALVTVERDGIISSRVETLTGSAPQVEIRLDEKHLPNVFVSVMLLNGRSAAPTATGDAGAPSFKIGYANLRVDPGVRHLRVEVEPNKAQYQPGEEVTVNLRLLDDGGDGVAGEIAFSAADAGVLNLIGYSLPDPFETFYGPRPLGVTTSETRANLVRQRDFGQKEEDVGGGGSDRSDDRLRKDFRPLAHWAPALRTDRRGRVQVKFRLPESLTTFRLMATGLTANHRFGNGQTDVVVTQPLVLQPALPRFARIADDFEAGVLVTNTTGAAGTATITAKGDRLDLVGPASKTVTLGEGETKEVRFRWKTPQTGDVKLTFGASLGRDDDAFEITLPVALPTTKTTTATFASATENAAEALRLPDGYVAGLGGFEARLASTALVGLDGAAEYLFTYPYGCLEQRTSAIRPLLAADDLLDAFDLEVLQGDRKEVIEEWLGMLDDFWLGDGFALWAGSPNSNPYVSAYVVLALAEARDAGFAIPTDLTRQAVDALDRQVRNRSQKPEYYSLPVWNDARALMLYALARHGRVLDGEVDALASQALEGGLSVEGESQLLRLIATTNRAALRRYRQPLLDRINQRVRVEATTAYLAAPEGDAYDWIFASDTRATAHGLAALIAAGTPADVQPLAERMVRYLMQRRQGGAWASTQDNAAVIDAFRAYHEAFETTSPDFTAQVKVAGKAVVQGRFSGRTLDVAEEQVALSTLPQGQQVPVTIEKSGAGRVYYSLRLQTFSAAPLPAAAHGLSVQRQLQRLDDRGQPAGPALGGNGSVTLQAGELVRVTLRLTSPTERNYVVVDDALPAGLEALNTAFRTTSQEAARDTGQSRWWGSFNHTEIRDDRVLLFADYLGRGEHTYTYLARATTPGTFVHPPAQAEMMYQPEINGRTATGTLVVQPPQGSGMATR